MTQAALNTGVQKRTPNSDGAKATRYYIYKIIKMVFKYLIGIK